MNDQRLTLARTRAVDFLIEYGRHPGIIRPSAAFTTVDLCVLLEATDQLALYPREAAFHDRQLPLL